MCIAKSRARQRRLRSDTLDVILRRCLWTEVKTHAILDGGARASQHLRTGGVDDEPVLVLCVLATVQPARLEDSNSVPDVRIMEDELRPPAALRTFQPVFSCQTAEEVSHPGGVWLHGGLQDS